MHLLLYDNLWILPCCVHLLVLFFFASASCHHAQVAFWSPHFVTRSRKVHTTFLNACTGRCAVFKKEMISWALVFVKCIWAISISSCIHPFFRNRCRSLDSHRFLFHFSKNMGSSQAPRLKKRFYQVKIKSLGVASLKELGQLMGQLQRRAFRKTYGKIWDLTMAKVSTEAIASLAQYYD